MATRQKEIQFSSRTRAFTDFIRYLNKVHYSVAGLLAQLPDELKKSDEAKFPLSVARRRIHNIVHLIYRPHSYERESKDYEFSRRSMEERWRAGYQDTVRTLRHPEVLERAAGAHGGVFVFDYARDD